MSLMLTSVTLTQTYADLQMGAGDIIVNIQPGNPSITNQKWILVASEGGGDVVASITATGVGSDLISFQESSITIEDGIARFVEFTVTVPADYKTDVKTMVLRPLLTATQLDTSGGDILVNTSVLKQLTLNVKPNPDTTFQEAGYYPSAPDESIAIQTPPKMQEDMPEKSDSDAAAGGLSIGGSGSGDEMGSGSEDNGRNTIVFTSVL